MIEVINHTPKPLTLMGIVASECWNSIPSPQIGVDCIESNHGRVLKYPDVEATVKKKIPAICFHLKTK